MRRFKQPPHGSYTPSPIHPPLRRSSTLILFPSMNETCVGYLSLSSIGSTLPSVSSIAGTPSSSEISSFRLSFGYFFCKSSSRSHCENLVLSFPVLRDILFIDVSLRNLDFGFFPYELMMSSVTFLIFVTSLKRRPFRLFSMFMTPSKYSFPTLKIASNPRHSYVCVRTCHPQWSCSFFPLQ